MREPPQILIDLIKTSEGFHRVVQRRPVVTAVPYLCPAGFWTRGYGVLCEQHAGPITLEQGEAELAAILPRYIDSAIQYSPRLLTETDGRFSAIVDFVFNLGPGRYAASTLRRCVNAGQWEQAKRELAKWVWGGGRKLPGLIARRGFEAEML